MHTSLVKEPSEKLNLPMLAEHHRACALVDTYGDGAVATDDTRQWHSDRAGHYEQLGANNAELYEGRIATREEERALMDKRRIQMGKLTTGLNRLQGRALRYHNNDGSRCENYTMARDLHERELPDDHNRLHAMQSPPVFTAEELREGRYSHFDRVAKSTRVWSESGEDALPHMSAQSIREYAVMRDQFRARADQPSPGGSEAGAGPGTAERRS
jgi:hypothetical protein